MERSSPKQASICNRTSQSTFVPMKSSLGFHMLKFWASSRSKWTSSHLKTVCGTEFPDRTFKLNCHPCLNLPGKKQQKPDCPQKPSDRYSDNSRNEFIRR